MELMGYFKLIRTLRDEWEEACVKKGLVFQGFRGQKVLRFAVCCYGMGERMSGMGAASLGSSWGRCMLRVPEK